VLNWLLDKVTGTGGGTGDLSPLIAKLEEMRTMMKKALFVDGDSEGQSLFERAFLFEDMTDPFASILKKAVLYDGAPGGEQNVSILKQALTFVDPQDLYRKGIFERAFLKEVEEMDGDQVVRVVKSLLDLLQMNVQDLSYIDAKMILGNFAMHVMGKCVEHT
jgi:hypothetical protein